MSRSRGGFASVMDGIGDASNVLLLVPSMEAADDEGCGRLLAVEPADEEDVLCITLTGSPDERRAVFRAHAGGDPARAGYVTVGDPARSAAADDVSIDLPGADTTIETVSSPADLTGIGIKISSVLSEWADDDNQIVVCFRSLTVLLQYVDVKQAFRFLHVITGRLAAVDAVAHYHMDPSAHDERTLNTIASLFDAVVEYRDGEWIVRKR